MRCRKTALVGERCQGLQGGGAAITTMRNHSSVEGPISRCIPGYSPTLSPLGTSTMVYTGSNFVCCLFQRPGTLSEPLLCPSNSDCRLFHDKTRSPCDHLKAWLKSRASEGAEPAPSPDSMCDEAHSAVQLQFGRQAPMRSRFRTSVVDPLSELFGGI